MKLYLKSLSGKAIQVETDPGATIQSIKKNSNEKKNPPPPQKKKKIQKID